MASLPPPCTGPCAKHLRPKPVRRVDHGDTKSVPITEMERYAEIIAALQVRTTNKNGRKVSTRRAIQLLEEHGGGLAFARPMMHALWC